MGARGGPTRSIRCSGRSPVSRSPAAASSCSRRPRSCRSCAGRDGRGAGPACRARSSCCARSASILAPISRLPGRRSEDPAGPPAEGRVAIESVQADRAAATVEADAGGHLVFSRTFFTAWKASVDGAPAPVLVANARDLAVAVPPGRHRVEFAYDARPFRPGVGLQALAFALAAAGGPRARAPRQAGGSRFRCSSRWR